LSTTSELAELHDLIGGLRRCVGSLKSRYGDSAAMRRIVIDADRILSDVELLDTDVSELDLARATVQQSSEKIVIPDTPYDSEFWRDVDDEGVGGHSRS
jgi:DeoR/GlpR family transcriptional regulator of sugar metabolism